MSKLSNSRSWSPICYHLTYVRGLIFEARGQFEDARQCYENTLSVNPTHLCSLYHLGRVYYQLGFYRLSEQTLKVFAKLIQLNIIYLSYYVFLFVRGQ
jgi:tetratricopeptide (TPR) repeat protein